MSIGIGFHRSRREVAYRVQAPVHSRRQSLNVENWRTHASPGGSLNRNHDCLRGWGPGPGEAIAER